MSSALLRPSPQVVLTEMRDGTAVLLHLDTKFYFTLNATGVFVWKLLAGSDAHTRESLAEAVTREFDVDVARASSDIDSLLDELRAEKLLVARVG